MVQHEANSKITGQPAPPACDPPLSQQLLALAADSGLSQDQLLEAALALWRRQRLR